MRLALLALGIAATLSPGGVGAEEQRAKTTDGKEVILRDDGTWAYAAPGEKGKPKAKLPEKAAGDFKKDKKAKLAYTGKRGTFTLSFAPGVWKKLDKSLTPDSEASFLHAEGDVIALVIAERIEVPVETLKDAVMENIRKADPKAKLITEDQRTVNGLGMVCLTVDATVDSVAFTYHVYLYTGDEGSIQLMTWTGRKLFKETKADMESFLNGFEVVKKDE